MIGDWNKSGTRWFQRIRLRSCKIILSKQDYDLFLFINDISTYIFWITRIVGLQCWCMFMLLHQLYYFVYWNLQFCPQVTELSIENKKIFFTFYFDFFLNHTRKNVYLAYAYPQWLPFDVLFKRFFWKSLPPQPNWLIAKICSTVSACFIIDNVVSRTFYKYM